MPPTIRNSTRRSRSLTQARRAANSELVRKRLGAPQREAYGPTEMEKLDIFKAKQAECARSSCSSTAARGCGGAAKNYADSAEMFVNAGANYVVLDFIAIKEAGGDLRVMAEQVRRGIAWTYKNAKSFGADPSRLYVGGHSSGGHLCGVALVTDWEKDHALPADIIKGGLCMSGMYDMKPVRLSKRSSYIKFTDEMEQAMSSLRHLPTSCARRSSSPTGPTRRPSSSGRTATSSRR